MHVKAFGVMTRHPVKVDQLPTDLRDVPYGRARPRRPAASRVPRRGVPPLREALEPLRSAESSAES
jgi:hypothetical protein